MIRKNDTIAIISPSIIKTINCAVTFRLPVLCDANKKNFLKMNIDNIYSMTTTNVKFFLLFTTAFCPFFTLFSSFGSFFFILSDNFPSFATFLANFYCF